MTSRWVARAGRFAEQVLRSAHGVRLLQIMAAIQARSPKVLREDGDEHVHVGRHTYGIGQFTVQGASAMSPVEIGSFCSVGPGVAILAAVEHRMDWPSTFPIREKLGLAGPAADASSKGAVRIGHDVWIGQNAIVLSGVTIGTGAVVGAAAVVTKDVPPYAIVVGNPARLLRFRFGEADREALLASAWWTLSDASIGRLAPAFCRSDIQGFLAAVAQERRLAAGGVPDS